MKYYLDLKAFQLRLSGDSTFRRESEFEFLLTSFYWGAG